MKFYPAILKAIKLPGTDSSNGESAGGAAATDRGKKGARKNVKPGKQANGKKSKAASVSDPSPDNVSAAAVGTTKYDFEFTDTPGKLYRDVLLKDIRCYEGPALVEDAEVGNRQRSSSFRGGRSRGASQGAARKKSRLPCSEDGVGASGSASGSMTMESTAAVV